jgi:hypothetical protein
MKRKAALIRMDDSSKEIHLSGQDRRRAGSEMRQQVVMAEHLKRKNLLCENGNGDETDRCLIAIGIGVLE